MRLSFFFPWDSGLRYFNSSVISLPSTSVTTLAKPVPSDPPVLCASQTPYMISFDVKGPSDGISFSAMRETIHTLLPSSIDLATLSEQFLAANSDRYINIFDSEKKKLLGSLITDQGVDSISFYSGSHKPRAKASEPSRSDVLRKQMLAVVTQNGAIELFSSPFHKLGDLQSNNSTSLKSSRKTMTRRSEATIKVVRPGKSQSIVPVVSVNFDGPDLVVAWAEGGVNIVFERIRWQDEETEELLIHGEKEVVRTKSSSALGSAATNDATNVVRTQVDESRAVVEQGDVVDEAMGEADQGAESALSDEDEELSSDETKNQTKTKKSDVSTTNRQLTKDDDDVQMEDADAEEAGEPSFGELVKAQAAEPIDVEAELDDGDAGALTAAKQNTSLQLPSGLSLATVLSQSLRTNDNNLLETCFHTTDVNIIRTTIQRMDSTLAATLLQKLAERLATRPGRYGHLLVWVQWTCVAHGGSIAGKLEILKKMTSLFKVMDQRSASLSSLLLLKGKLDMLDAQLGLRQNLQRRSDGLDSDDEDGIIYVEGEEDEAESDQDKPKKLTAAASQSRNGSRQVDLNDADYEEDDGGMPLTVNGVASDSEDDDEEDENKSDGEEALVDNEAEESDDDEGQGVSSDEDEDGEDEGEEEDGSMADFITDSEGGDGDSVVSVDAVPEQPPKKSKLKKGKSGK